jgi:hypothetical protein
MLILALVFFQMLDHFVALANQIGGKLIIDILEHVGGFGASLLLRIVKALHHLLLRFGLYFSLRE